MKWFLIHILEFIGTWPSPIIFQYLDISKYEYHDILRILQYNKCDNCLVVTSLDHVIKPYAEVTFYKVGGSLAVH